MKKSGKIFVLSGLSLLLLAGCSGVKQQLGIEHPPPDEFTVLKRAPLSMPPDYALRPPQPGAPRPQDAQTAEEARTTVFGANNTKSSAPTSADAALLKATGADQANDNIREAVDRETAAIPPKKKPVAQRLLGWTHSSDEPEQPATTVVDPVKEAARIKADKQQGKPVTAGDTPTQDE